ncbi:MULTISPECIES: helix-turn-helix domain-containing protein [Enterobacteriaceae]|uniref:helix-turn-helix domain-containing protein n=1 Tax=Enterobacteriaceae TaxID=543 RepID=UPI002FD7EBF3
MSSLVTVRPDDSFDYWHQVTCRNFSVTNCRAIPDQDFSGQVTSQQIGGLAFSDISSHIGGGHNLVIKREPVHIRRDGRQEVFLWLCHGGSIGFAQQGLNTMVRSGDLFIMDQTQPFTLSFSAYSSATLLIADRHVFSLRGFNVDCLAGKKIEADQRWARLLANIQGDVRLGAASTPPEQHATLEAMMLDVCSSVLQLAFKNTSPLHDERRRVSKLDQIKAYLRRNLGDADIDNEKIAESASISVRTLLRLFAEDGTTPMRWLIQERLLASRQAIEARHFERVTDVAYAFGFVSLSHFSRSFKDAFGVSPNALLK